MIKIIKLIFISFIMVLFVSCGPNIEEIGQEKGDAFLKELKEIDQSQPLSELIMDFNNTVFSNEEVVNDIISEEGIEGGEKTQLDSIISTKVEEIKSEINNSIQTRKKEGFTFSLNKTWKLKDGKEKNSHKSIFKIEDGKLSFPNLKGEYSVSVNEGSSYCQFGDKEATLEKNSKDELVVTIANNSSTFVSAKEEDLILGSFSGTGSYFGSTLYFTLNVSSPNKSKIYMKGPGGKNNFKLKMKSKGNGKYTFTDKVGDASILKYNKNSWSGEMSSIDVVLKRKKKETAYYVQSIFDAYTVEKSNEKSSSSSSSSSGNSKEYLDKYEIFVDDYIELLKKASDGDMSAIQEYSKVLVDIQALEREAGSKKENFSSSDLKRLIKIQTKLAKAATQL